MSEEYVICDLCGHKSYKNVDTGHSCRAIYKHKTAREILIEIIGPGDDFYDTSHLTTIILSNRQFLQAVADEYFEILYVCDGWNKEVPKIKAKQ